MKKNLRIFLATLAMTACGMANAQQLPNGTFDADWENCYPWEKGAKVSKNYGKQPASWCVSNVPNSLVSGYVASQVDGYSGKAVELKNTDALSNPIPAYMTLGTTWATAEANMAGQTRNTDGGVFGGISFKYRPDAIRFKYKSDSDQKDAATVVVYSWKGTWEQADVPSNTAVSISYGKPKTVTMYDRDVNILDKPHNTGGTVTHTSDAKLIASMSQTINELSSEWATFQKDLVYESTTDKPEKINVVIAAAGYQSTASITIGASITIDDVELVYYHSLTSLSYGGKAVAGFNENTLNYYLNEEYDSSKKVSYTVKGVAATATESYNEMTGVLTITVTNEDDKGVTTYNVQFIKKATFAVTDAKYGTFVAPFEVTIPAGVQAYVCDGEISGNALVLDEITGSIPANTPVVVYSENPLNNSVAGYSEANSTQVQSGALVGVYADTTVPAGAYVLQKQGDKAVGFYKVSTANTINIKANHAYLDLSSKPQNAPAAIFFTDEEATAVTSLNALMSGEVESVNNAAGVRQSGIQKGLNIVKTTDGSVHKILVK